MCGIAGFCNPEYPYTEEKDKWNHVLENMNCVQKHRGPDEDGTYLTKGCGLAHVRLSIIDLYTGQQPMICKEAGKTFAITYNGEIYNMPALRKELATEGVMFSTTSDTEVILKGYMKYGAEYVKRLNGIFAFGIWEECTTGVEKRKLTLFRDRLGVKPLFYAKKGDTLLFGSEIKSLFAFPDFKPATDRESMQQVLGLGPAKSYGTGVFANVKELLPGHYMEITDEGIRTVCYWQLISKPHEDSYEETVEKTSYFIQDAVKLQMLSDIPISTFLSGGVDSSLVTAICARELKKQGKQMHTFSFDFVDNSLYFKSNSFQPSEDRPWVDKMVEYAQTDHIYLECDNTLLADYLYKAVDARDLPCMTDIESSMLYFCSQVVSHNKVTLTGECADEIFGGYPWFHKEECFAADMFPWSMDFSSRNILLKDAVAEELDLENYAHGIYEKSVAETPKLAGENETESRRREIAYLNLKWFMVTLLDRMDRTSMFSGLEARVPFADHRIVEYIWNTPWEMKCPDGMVKGLLRAAGEDYLPKEVLYRKKSPYPKTYHPAYEKLLGDRLLEVMSDSNAPIQTYIDKKKVENFISSPKDYGKPWYGQLMAGPQLLAFWLQINYWMEKYNLQ